MSDKPLEWGVDLVVESASKFIGGHSDVIGGAIVMKSQLLPADFPEQVRWSTMVKLGGAAGAVQHGPKDSPRSELRSILIFS